MVYKDLQVIGFQSGQCLIAWAKMGGIFLRLPRHKHMLRHKADQLASERVRRISMHFLFVVLMILFPPDERPVPTENLRAGLMAALGESFEFVGAEVGSTNVPIVGSREGGRRMWFARVRPTKAGEFAFTYTAKCDESEMKASILVPVQATYTLPFKIGERGARRVIHPGKWGGSAYPHANVGDILVMGIHIDANLTDHKFAAISTHFDANLTNDPFGAPRTPSESAASFFETVGAPVEQRYRDRAANPPIVANRAPDQLRLLASWADSSVNRTLTHNHNIIRAYLEFTNPGEFNVDGKFTDVGDKSIDVRRSFRVRKKDAPVTVVLEHEDYTEVSRMKGMPESTMSKSGEIYGGTIEARVGDRICIDCGEYSTPAENKLDKFRHCEVVLQPFKPAAAYKPEKK